MVILLAFGSTAQAQKSRQDKDFVFPLQVRPHGFDCWSFSPFFYNQGSVYNPRSKVFGLKREEISSIRINPSGWSMAALSRKGDDATVYVFDLWRSDNLFHKFSGVVRPRAICYSADARRILIATDKKVYLFNAQTYVITDSLSTPHPVHKLAISDNGYYLAATDGHRVTVWNLTQKKVRKSFDLGESINDIAFTPKSESFAILTDDGLLALYDTKDFLINKMIDGMGEARSVSFHPDNKFVSVVTGDSQIAIINLFDDSDRQQISNLIGGIEQTRFIHDDSGRKYLAYNTSNSIIFHPVPELTPNYSRLLAEELDSRMNEWMRMMPGETLEEYKMRVNEDTRMEQMRLIEEEIATRLADNLVQMSNVSLGNYNQETEMLAINFDRMPTIYLQVPGTEVSDFLNVENLVFRNPRYGLNSKDQFELVYADVYNRASGKTYVFDNRERRVLDYLQYDDNFVPLDMVMLSNMEDIKLQEIKDRVVEIAKSHRQISNHTSISVNSRIIPSTDAEGKRIYNYKIAFYYEVEKGWSGREDFAPGKYKTEESGAARSLISIIRTAFENDFARYIKPGKRLQVNILGMADALPINAKIAYDGTYGEFISEPVYLDGELGNLTVTRSTGITQNEQLAFLRAQGLKQGLKSEVPSLREMETEYQCDVQVSPYRGGEFRRISVEFTFIDAL